ncbi:MAG: sulfite exporter TauE/SafE family protein [Actinomycetota bacterium]|nr:sulfite exporter TauE/SafE family protein [Actinomycetota bacterium]
MHLWRLPVVFVAALVAGVVNSIAGGGTLITFPVLVWTGLSPIVANATSTLALWPGYVSATLGFRRELRGMRRTFLVLAIPSLAGGLVGGILLLHTPVRTFDKVVPFLILGATLLLARQKPGTSAAGATPPMEGRGRVGAAVAFQFGAAVYGGYFGAALGFVLLVGFGFMGMRDQLQMSGLKNATTVLINGTALAYFIASGAVRWAEGLVMAVGAIAGGYAGASLSRRVGARPVRRVVVLLGFGVSIALLIRAF